MAAALTNEQRFIASCVGEGEAGVRLKLNAGRYGERKAAWASSWLDEVESGKSDATRAAERNSGSPKPKTNNRLLIAAAAVAFVLLGSAVIFLRLW